MIDMFIYIYVHIQIITYYMRVYTNIRAKEILVLTCTSTNYRTICIGFPIAHGNSFHVSPQGHHLVLRLACDTEETWERNAKGDEH